MMAAARVFLLHGNLSECVFRIVYGLIIAVTIIAYMIQIYFIYIMPALIVIIIVSKVICCIYP